MNPRTTIHGGILSLEDRRRIDAACDRFEAAWLAGERPDLASFLEGPPGPAKDRLFRELLALDLEYRRGAGERPDAGRYREGFPEHGDAIDSAFTLFEVDGPASSGVGTVGSARIARTDGEGDETSTALRAAGYEVLDELGRGGMGIVYRARQAAPRREVALKVIRTSGFASEGQRRRFRNEAEAVARLDHPNIVPIFEVGESRGLDYFSMKLIYGVGLDRRLDGFGDDPRAAARVVAVAAGAVHHAHRRGILHRDLKPANILLDGRGDPHLTDFGLARRIEGDGDLTRTGAILGTPAYMAPEQTTGEKGSLTTATDIYGLGAVLYALLTGRAPHAGGSILETIDLVRAASPAPPSRLNRRVPRDLEIICLKCLEKDPGRRYPGADALAEDLSRWLSGRPILARPIGPATRAGMWARRHPLPAALAASLALSVVVGFAGVAWKWREADRNAKHSAMLVDYLSDRVLVEASTAANPRGANLTVLEMLDRAAARIAGDFQGQPEAEAAIRETIGGAYLSLGEYRRAEPHLRAAVNLDTRLLGKGHPTALRASGKLAALLDESGRVAEADPLLRSNLGDCRRSLGRDDPGTLDASGRLGAFLRKHRRWAEAEPMLRATLEARRRVLPPDHPDTLRSIRDLCLLLIDRNRLDEADALAQEYEHGIRCARGPKHPDNVAALANRGLIRLLRGRPAEAEPYYRQAAAEARRILGPSHPATLEAVGEHDRLVRSLRGEGALGPDAGSIPH